MLSLLDLLRRMDAGTLPPDGALALCREAIAAREPEVEALVHLDETARPGAAGGPLAGIPLGVKDIIDVAGLPTRMGSPLYEGNLPRADAAIVAMARRAGAIPLAKTTTTPFAYLDPTRTRNPAVPDCTPGGSSSGSAAAVAAGMLPLALGTQTGGSVIRPAAYCGVAAIKPSARLLPTVGVKCFSWTLDTVGLFAASVQDVAHALAALARRPELALPEGDPLTNHAGIRLGILHQDFAGDPEPEAAAALDEAARAAERAGARLVALESPPLLADAWRLHGIIQNFEAAQALAWEWDAHRDALPPELRGLLDEAQSVDAALYDDARRIVHHAREAARGIFAEVDAILTFAAPGPAPRGYASTGSSRFNRLWTLLGDPCVAVPGLESADGRPVGVQTISRFGRDEKALAAGAFVAAAIAARR
ncbi:amidase [Salinarimonas ramus]|uniref:Amidase n=1 Tax=Salinarimonas ramus TaxID=690164 RepID=A0A917Q6J7_9HYPH|nr:amidase [Salinarimonas ramus]GGK29906.1 amidase [Salinarimonas ramus]